MKDIMRKYFLLVLLSSIIANNSCTDSLEPEYLNYHDPQSTNYIPTSVDSLSLSFNFDEMRIELTWSDNSHGELVFEIERRVAPNVEFIKVGEAPANSTSYFDNFIPSLNANYTYRIKTISSNGNFSYSETVGYSHNIFSKPTSLSVAHQNIGSLKLSWIDRNTIEDGFIIKMRDPKIPGSSFEVIGNVDKDVNQFIIEGLDTNNVYEFSVTAFNSYYQVSCDTAISTIFGMEISQLWQLTNHLYSQNSKFSPISNLLAIGGWPETENISLYNISTFEFRATNFTNSYLEFNTTGTKLGLLENWSSANPISIVDVNSLSVDKTINFPSTGFSFSPDGSKIFVWNENNLILRLVDLSTGNSVWSKNISQIYDAKFNYTGDKIYCSTGTQILILDSSNGNIIGSIAPQGYVVSFEITNDDKYLYIASSTSNHFSGESLIIWDVKSSSVVKIIDIYVGVINLSPDQKYIAIGYSDFSIFRTSDFEKICNINPSWGGRVFSLSFNPNSSFISVCSEYDHPKVFSLNRKWIKKL